MVDYKWHDGYEEGYRKWYADGMAYLQETMIADLIKNKEELCENRIVQNHNCVDE